MSKAFTAIDFETANGKRSSSCDVGLVRVENNIITAQLSILVQPPGNYYWDNFIDIHDITPEQTASAPTFDKVWPQLAPFIENQQVVAHNGFAFDFACLKQTLAYYHLPNPDFTAHCTYKLFRQNLASLCEQYQIHLIHHDALSDAKACAELFKIYLEKN